MPADAVPFESFVFNLSDRANGRVLFSLTKEDEDNYELHVEKGPASQLTANFTRTVPRKTAEVLRDACADLGVFGWDEEYPDEENPGAMRWNLAIVYKEGVFSQKFQGGSSTPEGFGDLLEQLYQLDLPRPGADDAPMMGAMPAGMPDFGSLFSGAMMDAPGAPDAGMIAAMQETMNELQNHPERFQQQMKEEFRQLPPEQQNQMLDMLASTGFATREWWENFLRG